MKIGILTHYLKNPNYGGNLQAYALVEFLRSSGFDCEQICYDMFFKREQELSRTAYFLKRMSCVPGYALSLFKSRVLFRGKTSFVSQKMAQRLRSIYDFNQNTIKHGADFYSYGDIGRANDVYDAFITGSDQVWHPHNFCPAYLLTFAKGDKKKISYAASIAKSDLSKEEIDCIVSSISDYTAVSVREEDSAALLRKHCPKEISCVVDPVFLLSDRQWDSISRPYSVDKPYVLTYFLGENSKSRALARDFAKKNGFKLVSFPYLNGAYRKCDWNFGDEQLFNVGPAELLTLIKNAACVFPDSFHATAFSIIYGNSFFVFPREQKDKIDMSNRIYSILDICRCSQLYCDSEEKQDLAYLNSVFDCIFADKQDLERRTAYSKDFLMAALK